MANHHDFLHDQASDVSLAPMDSTTMICARRATRICWRFETRADAATSASCSRTDHEFPLV